MWLMFDGEAGADGPTARTGGLPLAPKGFVWPECGECEEAMCFVAHLPVADGAIEVFMCQSDPGMCDDWDADAGGNRAVLVRGELYPVAPPADGETLLDSAVALRPSASDEGGEVLGRLGGEPDWWQADETPTCAACGRPMGFVAQLEEGDDRLNFVGGGRGYVFACRPCGNAKFLWQR